MGEKTINKVIITKLPDRSDKEETAG